MVAGGNSDMLLFLGAGRLGGLGGSERRQIPGLKILGELSLRGGEAGAVVEEVGRRELAAVHHLHPCSGGVSAATSSRRSAPQRSGAISPVISDVS